MVSQEPWAKDTYLTQEKSAEDNEVGNMIHGAARTLMK